MKNIYSVYCIIQKSINTICYVGYTKESLNTRFLKHCNEPGTLYNIIQQYGRYDFSIRLINETTTNLTKQEATDLEKKYIRDFSQIYTLYNKEQYKDPLPYKGNIIPEYNLTINEIKLLDTAVLCITTNEIFESTRHAAYKYNINLGYFNKKMNKCPIHIGYNINNMPLYWRYLNKEVNIIPIFDKLYTIYIIYQLINNQWTPIYVGSTSMTLEKRLSAHKYNKTSALYNILHENTTEKFKIESAQPLEKYTNITNKNDAYKLEEQLTIQLQSQYQLYNRYIGNKPTQYYTQLHLQLLQQRSLQQYENNENHISVKTCVCIETLQVYSSLAQIVKEFKVSKNVFIKIKQDCTFTIQGLHFQIINSISKQLDKYIIYAIIYNDNIIYLFYTKYNILYINKGIQNSKYKDYINYLYSTLDINKIIYIPIHININTEIEAEQLCNNYFQVLTYLNYYLHNGKIINNFLKNINHKSIQCLNDKKIYNTMQLACKEYDIALTSMKRHLANICENVFSRKLNKYLRFIDINNKNIKRNYNIYYILHNNIPILVLYSKSDANEVLNHQLFYSTTSVYRAIKKNNLQINDFSCTLIQDNIETKLEARFWKKLHITILQILQYPLYNTLI